MTFDSKVALILTAVGLLMIPPVSRSAESTSRPHLFKFVGTALPISQEVPYEVDLEIQLYAATSFVPVTRTIQLDQPDLDEKYHFPGNKCSFLFTYEIGTVETRVTEPSFGVTVHKSNSKIIARFSSRQNAEEPNDLEYKGCKDQIDWDHDLRFFVDGLTSGSATELKLRPDEKWVFWYFRESPSMEGRIDPSDDYRLSLPMGWQNNLYFFQSRRNVTDQKNPDPQGIYQEEFSANGSFRLMTIAGGGSQNNGDVPLTFSRIPN